MAHSTDKFPELETERLILGEITKEHDQWYLRYFSTPEIVAGHAFEAPQDIEAAREELDKYIVGLFVEGAGVRWGIRLKEEPESIGTVGFAAWDKESQKAEMGYDLLPEYWGKGIMTEAMKRAIQYGFEEMALNRIEVSTAATNKNSAALLERLGFTKEGVMREWSKWKGEYVDELVFSLLRREWLPDP